MLESFYKVDLVFKMTVLTRPFQRAINQYCSIHSSYAINEKPIFGKYTLKRRSATKFDLRGLSLKKYYGKPIEDRTLIFAPILLICNDVYGKKFIGPSHVVLIWSRGGGNFLPPPLVLSVTKKALDLEGLIILAHENDFTRIF